MQRTTTLTLLTAALLCLAVAMPAGEALAQQKQKVSYTVTAANSKYTQRHVIEVGDQSGHQLGIYEIQRTFPANAPVINGVKLKEQLTRGTSDFVSGNGASTNYGVYVLENGDKFFAVSTTLGQADAGGKRSTVTVGHITGGTGKLAGMQGMIRAKGASDGKAGMNETQAEIEYWLAK